LPWARGLAPSPGTNHNEGDATPKSSIYSSKYLEFSDFRPSTLLRDARLALKASRVYPLPDWVKEEVVRLFLRYLEVTKSSVIVLEDEDGFFCYVPYRHRFSNIGDVIRRFDEIFRRASKRYRVGVWVTLTTDPNVYSNDSYLSYRYKIVKALNRFLSWLRKRFGKISYVCVFEFTDSGLIHFHVVIFGLGRIEDYRIFTKRLVNWGFGRVNYLYQIVNINNEWKPRKVIRIDYCDGGGIPKEFSIVSRIGLKNYLKKYISKSLRSIRYINSILSASNSSLDSIYSVSQTSSSDGISQSSLSSLRNGVWKLALYWALRLRFFSYSKNIMVSSKRVGGRYSFVGVFSVERYIVYNNYFHDWLLYPTFLCLDVSSATEVMF